MTPPPITEWLLAVQRGLPLVTRPFAEISEQSGVSEAALLADLKGLFAAGRARRFGAVFDARRLGYKSVLCALRVDADDMDDAAEMICRHPGVTHCYHRGWPDELDRDRQGGPGRLEFPNLWFTFAELVDDFDTGIDLIQRALQPAAVHLLPAVRRFKIDVVFHPSTRDRGELFPGAAPRSGRTSSPGDNETFHRFTDEEKRVVRLLQGDAPLCPQPFAVMAEALGWDESRLLATLRDWKEQGVLRRFAVILRHQQMGFKANGMCTWRVPIEDAREAGRKLAGFKEVTHCYERNPIPGFPFNLYAMIHAGSYDAALARYAGLSEAVGLRAGGILFSLREFKKMSPVYFPGTDSLAPPA